MEKKIHGMLQESVRPADLLAQIAVKFYERIEEMRTVYRTPFLMLQEYENFKEYFQANNEDLSEAEISFLQDIQEDMVYQVEVYFDEHEDRMMEAFVHGPMAAEIKEDMQKRGIVLIQELSADEVETVYAGAFEAYDQLHVKFVEKLFALSPLKAYKQGEKQTEDYRKKHHIVFDEKDFIEFYMQTFSKDNLWRLLRERFDQAIRYGRHYDLLIEAEDDVDDEEEKTDDRWDIEGVLEPGDAFSMDMFDYVYELMQEYTGRRVLPSENEWGGEAYWTTYQDDFQEILGFFILDHFERTLQKLEEERGSEFAAFGRMLGLEKKDRTDPEQVLLRCDRVNYYLTQLNEELWNEFTETKVVNLMRESMRGIMDK